MATLPMFPLGAVLFPHMPLSLRVFEARYAVMLTELLQSNRSRFGVVLIERGQEVGGGEHRFDVGTVAEITSLRAEGGMARLTARGAQRIRVTQWLPDAPYPRAEVTALPELRWSEDLTELRDQAERLVRGTLAVASEFSESAWPADIELSDDPLAATWQLAGVAPIGALDQMALLQAESAEELLVGILERTREARETLTASWPDQAE